MTRIIAIALTKGGVGKTTTAVNLAAALARLGRQVLLVDTDTQGQAGDALGLSPAVGLADVLMATSTAAEAIIEARPGLDLLSGGPELAAAKRAIARVDFRGEETMRKALRPLVSRYDYILVDTSPGWDPLQVNVLFFAGEVLAPVSLETLALRGLINFLARVEDVQAHHGLQLRYIVPTALDRRVKQSGEILGQLRAAFGELVCRPIRYNVRLSEAPAHGQHIFEYAGRSAGAADYAALTGRVLQDE